MEEAVQELIEAKMKLAESQENLLIKSQVFKELSEKYCKKQEEVEKMQEEIRSLYDSISQLTEERSALVLLVEASPRAGSIQSLDSVEEEWHQAESVSGRSSLDLWTAISKNWNKLKSSKKLRNLCRKGIHSNVRGQIWCKMLENRLNLTVNLYNILLNKTRSLEKPMEIPAELKKSISPEQQENLVEVLGCFSIYRPDFHYSPVMACLALVFCSCLPNFEAFQCYKLIRSFYSYNLPQMQVYYKIIEHFLEKKAPSMLKTLQEFGIYLDTMIIESVSSVFAKCVPVEYASRLIDMILIEDECYLIKICVAVYICLNQVVKGKDINGVTSALSNIHLHIPNPEDILRRADKLKIGQENINNLKLSIQSRNSQLFKLS